MNWSSLAESAVTPLALLLYLSLAGIIAGTIYWIAKTPEPVPQAARVAIFSVLALGLLPSLLNFNAFRGYSIKVNVLDLGAYPAAEAQVVASTGTVTREALDWRLDIPPFARFATAHVTIRASVPDQGLTGQIKLALGNDHSELAVLQLDNDQSPSVRGVVVDPAGVTIDGAVVAVSGHPTESVVSQFGGRFVLPAHARRDDFVWVYAEAHGHPWGTEWLQAGGPPGTLILGQQPKDGK